MLLKRVSSRNYKIADWEQVPDEDLWEDGERTPDEVQYKVINNVLNKGEWIIIRRINNG